MENPLDSKEGLALLDLDDLLAYRTRKFLSTSPGYTLGPQTSLPPLLIHLHPTTNDTLAGSYLLAQQGNRYPFLQPQLHTTNLELKPIPLPIPTFFPLALPLNSTNLLHGYTPFSLSGVSPISLHPLSHDLVVSAICSNAENQKQNRETPKAERPGSAFFIAPYAF